MGALGLAEAHFDGDEGDDDWYRLSTMVDEVLREEDGRSHQLMRRMWHMMQTWEQQRQRLQQQLDEAVEQAQAQSEKLVIAESARLAAEAAEAASAEKLEAAERRLVQGREALKCKDQELEEARSRWDLLEAELQDARRMARQAEAEREFGGFGLGISDLGDLGGMAPLLLQGDFAALW
ncbi:unnamed protein product [Effrenium voratum]|nr:unnamed protein product [Effrenium voratum]